MSLVCELRRQKNEADAAKLQNLNSTQLHKNGKLSSHARKNLRRMQTGGPRQNARSKVLLIQTKRKKYMKPSKQSMDQRTTQFTL